MRRIGELLVEAHRITSRQLNTALDIQRTTGDKLVEILISRGYLTRRAFEEFLAGQGIPSVNLEHYQLDPTLASLIPREFAVSHELFPLDRLGRILSVGMVCPLDRRTLSDVHDLTGLSAKPLLCSAHDLHALLKRAYGTTQETTSPFLEFENCFIAAVDPHEDRHVPALLDAVAPTPETGEWETAPSPASFLCHLNDEAADPRETRAASDRPVWQACTLDASRDRRAARNGHGPRSLLRREETSALARAAASLAASRHRPYAASSRSVPA